MKPFLASPLCVDFEAIRRREEGILRAEHSLNTRRTYASGWKAFGSWCAAAGLEALPAKPQTVRDFATWCLAEGYRLETVLVRTSAIAHYHERAEHCPNPVDESVWNYLTRARRELKEQPRSKHAITAEMLRRMARRLRGDDPLAARDRAMLLLCFAAGWRRSEVTALQRADVCLVRSGVTLWQRHSKVDQQAKGRLVGIPCGRREMTCPVRALRKWLQLRGDWEGPLFVRFTNRRGLTRQPLGAWGTKLYAIVKDLLSEIGENPELFGAHSLRAGMITEAAKHGASEASIKQRTGHRCSATLQRYIRPATAFDFDPLRGVL